MTEKEALKLGLDYEPDYKVTVVDDQHPNGVPLEQWGRPAPVKEPVAFFCPSQGFYWAKPTKIIAPVTVDVKPLPLYTTPPAAPDLQAELDATDRQVEILSDALAESQREVAALKAVQEPVHQWRQKHSPYWYDGYPDSDDGGGPYETRILYTTPPAAQPAPVQVSPLEFVTMVMEKEHLVGKPIFWAEWPNKEYT